MNPEKKVAGQTCTRLSTRSLRIEYDESFATYDRTSSRLSASNSANPKYVPLRVKKAVNPMNKAPSNAMTTVVPIES